MADALIFIDIGNFSTCHSVVYSVVYRASVVFRVSAFIFICSTFWCIGSEFCMVACCACDSGIGDGSSPTLNDECYFIDYSNS